jgi:hypothetical protein
MATSTMIRISQNNLALYGITTNRLFIFGNTSVNCCARYEGVREQDLKGIHDMRVMHTSSTRGTIIVAANNMPCKYSYIFG